MDFAAIITAAGLYAPGVTKATDLVRNAFDKAGRAPKWTWNVVPMLLGVGVAFVGSLAFVPTSSTVLSEVLSGIVIGGLAGGWHEVFDAFSGYASARHGEASVSALMVATPQPVLPVYPGAEAHEAPPPWKGPITPRVDPGPPVG